MPPPDGAVSGWARPRRVRPSTCAAPVDPVSSKRFEPQSSFVRATCPRPDWAVGLPDDRVRKLAKEFDILHFHIDEFHFPLFAQMADRTVTTLHGRQDLPDLKPLYIGFSEMPLVSISNDQRRSIAKANVVAAIHHGIPTNLH